MSRLGSPEKVGSPENPLRVAIIGSGPAGFYTVSNLLKHKDLAIEMDMFERLPTPFGLVRAGVAPDHQKDKTVTRAYDKSAESSSFRFFGNVEFGNHIQLEDIKAHYHQVVFATGAHSDRHLDIPGERFPGSHTATEFVAWYNGHPDFAHLNFDLSGSSAAIIGLGNVAIDVARILCKTPEELETTDIADYALEAVRASRVKTVYILGRRGPAQAAFSPPEIKEMGELAETDVQVRTEEAALDALSSAALARSGDKNARRNVELIDEFAHWHARGKDKQLIIRFMVSPVELLKGDDGRVAAIRIVKNEAYQDENGQVRARATTEEELLPVDLVFRSVGYKGVELPGIPFDEAGGTFRNVEGRITDQEGAALPGLYVAGWIKRGPTGVIGSNKTDAKETVTHMIADLLAGQHMQPDQPGIDAAIDLITRRQPELVTYEDWRHIDDIEVRKGLELDRPRVKFTDVDEMLRVLER
jgi:ferredoxin--NADP+ reductase